MLKQIAKSKLEFTGSKDPYAYFLTINELCDSLKLNGHLLSTEPLQYRFHSKMFFDHSTATHWNTNIIITLEKSGHGTSFFIKPKFSSLFWIVSIITILSVAFNLLFDLAKNEFNWTILLYFIPTAFVFLLDKYHSKKLIYDFKEKVISCFES